MQTAAPPDSPAAASCKEFGTRLLRTHVSPSLAGSYVWTRFPGPIAPTAFVPIELSVDPRLARLSTDLPAGSSGIGTRLALGTAAGSARRYRAGSNETVASLLLDARGGVELAGHLHGLGRLLRGLHETFAPEEAAGLAAPRGLDRLSDWLADRPAAGEAAVARDRLRAALGVQRWDLLRGWTRDLRTGDGVLSHGAPGLGSLVVGGAGGGPVLLTGEDLSAAPWTFDVGWVAGELIELAWQLGWKGARWQPLLDALFAGYGRDLGAEWHRSAAVRVMLHVHDFSAYADRTSRALPAYGDFVRFLVDLEKA